MQEKTGLSNKILKLLIIPLVVIIGYLSYQFLYMNGQAKDIKSIQGFSKITKTAYLLNDNNTLKLINDAKADGKITRNELKALRQSSMQFKREVTEGIKPAEQREKEFMERKAKYEKNTQNSINNG